MTTILASSMEDEVYSVLKHTYVMVATSLIDRDEEYDRGKRKKIRVPAVSFDGPNLFQEIADKRLKTKRSKLERSRDGNQPFRI